MRCRGHRAHCPQQPRHRPDPVPPRGRARPRARGAGFRAWGPARGRRPTVIGGAPLSIGRSRLLSSRFLSDRERDLLAAAFLPPRLVKPGRQLMKEVDGTDCLYLVMTGWAYRFATLPHGECQLLGLSVPGDIANMDSLMVKDLPYRTMSLSEAQVAGLPRQRAHDLAGAHPGIARTFAWMVTMENIVLGKWMTSMGRRTGKARLAHLLSELAVRLRCPDDDVVSFPFCLTQAQFGDALGMTSVHINRLMQAMRREALIATRNQTMTLLDVRRLHELAGFDPVYLRDAP